MANRCFGVNPPEAIIGGHVCNTTSTSLQSLAPQQGQTKRIKKNACCSGKMKTFVGKIPR
jgi:hypothetical protein